MIRWDARSLDPGLLTTNLELDGGGVQEMFHVKHCRVAPLIKSSRRKYGIHERGTASEVSTSKCR
jgi:hypothetical protein